METKEQLIQHIKAWITIDNEIRDLQAQIKEKKEKRKNYTDSLVDVMKKNEIDCFDINDGKLIFSQTKVKAPLNKNNLFASFLKYFDNDAGQAKDICDFLLTNREEKIKESLRRKIEK